MIAAALQVIPQTWPALLHPHPWAVVAFIVVGGVLFAYGFASHRKSEASSDFIGGDNKGHRITAGRDVIIGDAKIASEVNAKSNPEPILKPSVKLPARSVELQIEPGMPNISYDDVQACWKENNYDGRTALVLWVMNPIAPVGLSGRPTPAIAAHLILKAKDGSSVTIPRAYWVHAQENEVVLDVGHRAGVVVGYAEYSSWVVPENPHSVSPFENAIFAVPFCPVGPRHVINRATPIAVGLSIISTRDGKTLLHKKFEIHFTPKGVTITESP